MPRSPRARPLLRLEVHLYETHFGDLVGDSWRDFDFLATGAALDRFGVGSTVLSESVPLVPRQPRGKAAQRRVFFNEEYASCLARALGLVPYATWIETFEATDALVIERYDRDDAMPDRPLHQEDFNRALGASGAQKYQKHGGRTSLGRVAALVTAVQGREGLEQLLALRTLATAICNLDMQAKNISLLHPPDGSGRLALAYVMVPLIHYPGTDGRMAMAINNVYEHSRIRRDDLVAESVRWA